MARDRLYPEPTGEVRMSLSLRFAAGSHKGMIREGNEDSGYAGPRLLAIADGMGGQAAGEVASSEVISTLVQLDDDVPGSDILTSLSTAVQRANDQLRVMVEEDFQLEGMGTTLTAILFAGSRLGLVHIGDSRAYQLRDGYLTQITKDDTFVQSLIDEGRITEEEAHTHPQRSLLLRAITGQDIDPSLTIREARPGDRFLLCSDGLSGVVSDETLAETLQAYRDPRECADRMIELALRGGGPDNITCIVADVVDIDFGEDAPIVGGSVGDGSEDGPPPDSAAARASATTLTRTAPQQVVSTPETRPSRRRGRLRVVLAVVAVLAVLAGGGLLARMWVMAQYYVSADGEQVAIFQGVGGEVLGVALQSVAERTDVALTDLPETERSQVRDGITTDNGLAGAHGVVDRLRARMLEPCPPPQPPQPPPPVVDPGVPVPGIPPVDTTPLPTPAPEPGTTCRSVG